MITHLAKMPFTANKGRHIGLSILIALTFFGCDNGGGGDGIPNGRNCNGTEFEPETHFCRDNTIYGKCGGYTFNPNVNRCDSDGASLLNLCGTEWYKPEASKYCYNGSLRAKDTFTDTRNGTVYKSVTIGTQVWMAENLNVPLPYFSKCYEDLDSNCEKYGRLYNWTAAGSVCPPGWHLPTAAEWITLIDFVENGEEGSGARKLKAVNDWQTNSRGTDDYGFSALPGGMCFSRNETDTFDDIGYGAFYWTETRKEYGIAYFVDMKSGIYRENGNLGGDYTSDYMSIRCLKDSNNSSSSSSIVTGESSSSSGDSEWTRVTQISQVEGSWHTQSSNIIVMQGIVITQTFRDYVVTFNTATSTMSISGVEEETYSGENIDLLWQSIRENIESVQRPEGMTITIDDASHSSIATYNNASEVIPANYFLRMDMFISNDGTTLKAMNYGDTEIIYVRQQ